MNIQGRADIEKKNTQKDNIHASWVELLNGTLTNVAFMAY